MQPKGCTGVIFMRMEITFQNPIFVCPYFTLQFLTNVSVNVLLLLSGYWEKFFFFANPSFTSQATYWLLYSTLLVKVAGAVCSLKGIQILLKAGGMYCQLHFSVNYINKALTFTNDFLTNVTLDLVTHFTVINHLWLT